MDHYTVAVFSEPGRCWRFVYAGEGSGRPMHCPEPVEWPGSHRFKGGRRVPVWSCEGDRRDCCDGAPGLPISVSITQTKSRGSDNDPQHDPDRFVTRLDRAGQIDPGRIPPFPPRVANEGSDLGRSLFALPLGRHLARGLPFSRPGKRWHERGCIHG